MRDTLSDLCGQFIQNRDVLKSTFGWESSYFYPICAAIFTDQRQRADRERLLFCRDILRQQTGVFSSFRGTGKLAMISMLAVDKNPEGKLEKALWVYEALKKHFFTSAYLPVAAMAIANLAEPGRYELLAERTRRIYDLMKREHPILTSGEDSVLAALLAFSARTDEEVVEETEQCYRRLKGTFFSGNAVQSLSHVLALGEGGAGEKCERTVGLFRALKERGLRYGTEYELATLGVLALLPADQSQVLEDLIEVDRWLSAQKGYGLFGLGRKQRLMHAGMLVTSDYLAQSGHPAMHTAAIGGVISLIAAQQAAMCAAIAASAAASSASTNS